MYFVCTDRGEAPIAHATLERARETLESELAARRQQGYTIAFNDRLEYELSRDPTQVDGEAGEARAGARPDAGGGRDRTTYRLWIEDDQGHNVMSRDAAEAG
jgi:hypothetical protein